MKSISKLGEDLPPELREIFERNKGFVPDIDSKNAEKPAKAGSIGPASKKLAEINKGLGLGMSFIANVLARTSIFAPAEKTKKREKVEIEKAGQGYIISISGEQLDEFDRDVFLVAIQLFMSAGIPPGSPFKISFRPFLTLLGRSYGSNNIKSVTESLHRMADIRIKIRSNPSSKRKERYTGSLLSVYTVSDDSSDDSKNYVAFSISADIIANMFGDYTRIPMGERLALKGRFSQLAKWLDTFIRSHEFVMDISLKTYYNYVYNDNNPTQDNLRWFRRAVKTALELLKSNGNILLYRV